MKEKNSNNIFASNLRYYLEEKGYRQADLARGVKVSTGTVADWCMARSFPRMDKVEMIADFLGIEKSDLIEEHNQEWHNKNTAREIANDIIKNPMNLKLYQAIKHLSARDKEVLKTLIKTLGDNNIE